MTGTEVTTATTKDLSTDVMGMGIADDLTMDDIGIGRICLMQASSDPVKKGLATQGTFVNMANPSVVLGDRNNPLEIILVSRLKYWVETDKASQEFIAKYPAKANENELAWEETVNGREIKRTFHSSFIVLLPKEIATGVYAPYELAFRITSLKVAKQLLITLRNMAGQKIPSWAKTFKIHPGNLESKGKNSWLVPTVEIGRDTTIKEIEVVQNMNKSVQVASEQIMEEKADVYAAESAPIPSAPEMPTEF